MRNLYLLVKLYFAQLIGLDRYKKRGFSLKSTFYPLLVGFCSLALAFLAFFYSWMIGDGLKALGMLDLLPPMLFASACLVVLFTTLYKAGGALFSFGDYDLLASLPVSHAALLASRVAILYSLNIAFTLLVMLPGGAAYAILARPDPLFYPIYLLLIPFVPLIPIILAGIAGVLISAVAARFRFKNLINLLATLLVFLGTMALSFSVQLLPHSDSAQLGSLGATLLGTLDRVYPLTGMFARAVCRFEPLSILLFILLSAGAFALFSLLFGRLFGRIQSALSASHQRRGYRMGQLHQGSPLMALIGKEFRRLFGSPAYLLNSAVGAMMILIASAWLCFFPPSGLDALLAIPELRRMLLALLPPVLCFFLGISSSSGSSISLEGPYFWLLRSLPLSTRTIFLSKVLTNLLLLLPATLLSCGMLSAALRPDPLSMLCLFLMPTACCLLTSVMGLVINVALPKFDWQNETAVVKQSAAAFAVVFAGMALELPPIPLLFLLPSVEPALILLGWTALLLLLTLLLSLRMCTVSVRKFEALEP